MERKKFGKTDLEVSPIVLGTWVTGGWLWGGAEDKESIRAILRALELGINFIDTAPVYGFGRSESVIAQALKDWGRNGDTVIATKCGLEWDEKENVRRNCSAQRIRQEVEDSLKRLNVDRIDLYQLHWPDPNTPIQESMEALVKLRDQGKIRYVGLSNFNSEQMEECLSAGEVHSLQPPYNMFERGVEREILPFCMDHDIATLGYGGLCRGLLTGKFTGDETFPKGDLRRVDPKFKPDRFKQYVNAVRELKEVASGYGKTVAQFALRWALQQPGMTTIIAGARTPSQVEDNAGVAGWEISQGDLQKVEEILSKHIQSPVGPEFMSPRK